MNTNPVFKIKSSEWAESDVSTLSILNALYGGTNSALSASSEITNQALNKAELLGIM